MARLEPVPSPKSQVEFNEPGPVEELVKLIVTGTIHCAGLVLVNSEITPAVTSTYCGRLNTLKQPLVVVIFNATVKFPGVL